MARGENDANGIRAEQRVHQDVVPVWGDRVREARRWDAFEVLEGGFWPDGADLAAHGPHTARSLPTGDRENLARLHSLRARHARHGLVRHHAEGELHRAG